VNRQARRKLQREERKLRGDISTVVSKRHARMLAKAERDRKRYARLSQERLVDLIEDNVRRLNDLKQAYDAGVVAGAATDVPHEPTQAEREDLFRETNEGQDPAFD
jgi:hypothetical protein